MDLAMVILSAIAVIVSIVSICISYNASQKGNSLTTVANDLTMTANKMQKSQLEMQMGQIEMQIRELISSARTKYQDAVYRLQSDSENEVLRTIVNSAKEDYLNAYDEACAKYLDGKVDKERFKKLYHDEIKQVIKDDAFSSLYIEPCTSFHATVKVYNEWYNLEG